MKKKYTLNHIIKILESYLSDLRHEAKTENTKENRDYVDKAETVISDFLNNHLFLFYASKKEVLRAIELQEEELERVVKRSEVIMKENTNLTLDEALRLSFDIEEDNYLDELLALSEDDETEETVSGLDWEELFGEIGVHFQSNLKDENIEPVQFDNSDKPKETDKSLLDKYKGKHPIEYLQKVIHDKMQKKTIGHSVRAFINIYPKGFERNEIEAVIKYKMYPEEITLFTLCNSLGLEYNTIAKLYEENA